MSAQRISSLAEFWPYYLREHSRPVTRAWHYIGSTFALVALGALLATGNPWFLMLAVAAGYGPAWIGHFGFEKNRPATFQYPLWSLLCDWRMYFAWLSGRLGPELARSGVSDTTRQPWANPGH